MYMPSTQFGQVTNRESWTQNVGIYDDASGQPINLTNTGGQGTFAAWAVQISAQLYGPTLVSTTSVSSLTIGNGSFNAVVATGLAIAAGQSVTFLSQANNANFLQGQVTAYNAQTGAISFTVSTVAIQLEIRRVSERGYLDGYGPNYSVGSYDYTAPILQASIGNGITIVDTGIFQIYFSETQFRSLCPGMHSVNATIASADGIDVRQLFLGRLPVFAGGVSN